MWYLTSTTSTDAINKAEDGKSVGKYRVSCTSSQENMSLSCGRLVRASVSVTCMPLSRGFEIRQRVNAHEVKCPSLWPQENNRRVVSYASMRK